jgi:DNA-binding CsgD family transcriptional regulator
VRKRPGGGGVEAAGMSGKVFDRFSGLVDDIYKAALEPGQWSSAVQRVSELHQCRAALLLTPSTAPKAGGFIFAHGLSAAHLDMWATKYVNHDPWVKVANEKDVYHEGNVFLSDDLLSREDLEKTVFYREYLTQVDVGSFCTGIVFNGKRTGYAETSCSFFNRLRAPAFTEHDKKLHSLTVTHLSRALGTMYTLRDAELRLAANMAALDRVSAGVLLFGERGNVVFANASASKMLASGNGLAMRVGNAATDGSGWLQADDADDQARLTRAISEAIAMQPVVDAHFMSGTAFRRKGRRPLLLQLSSLTAGNEFSRGERESWAIGFLSELGASPRLDPAMLQTLFSLTAAESALAQAVLGGDSLEQVAAELGVSPNTVKTQLKSIYVKTDTHRQAQLVRLLMGLASDSPPGA